VLMPKAVALGAAGGGASVRMGEELARYALP